MLYSMTSPSSQLVNFSAMMAFPATAYPLATFALRILKDRN